MLTVMFVEPATRTGFDRAFVRGVDECPGDRGHTLWDGVLRDTGAGGVETSMAHIHDIPVNADFDV